MPDELTLASAMAKAEADIARINRFNSLDEIDQVLALSNAEDGTAEKTE